MEGSRHRKSKIYEVARRSLIGDLSSDPEKRLLAAAFLDFESTMAQIKLRTTEKVVLDLTKKIQTRWGLELDDWPQPPEAA